MDYARQMREERRHARLAPARDVRPLGGDTMKRDAVVGERRKEERELLCRLLAIGVRVRQPFVFTMRADF